MSSEQAVTTTNAGETTLTTQAPIETSLQPVVPETLTETAVNQTAINTTEPATTVEEPITTTTTEPPKAPEEGKTSSPRQGPAHLLTTLPSFLKKPFEKKHDDASAPTTTTTTTTTTAVAGEHAEPTEQQADQQQADKSEKRLSRTIFDLFHKKGSNKPEEVTAKDESTTPAAITTTENEPREEGNVSKGGEQTSSKEPLIDHLRRIFNPKKPTEATVETSDNTPHADDTQAPAATTNTVESSSPAANKETKTEEQKASLTRRFSKLAQNWTHKLKEPKNETPAATTTASNEPTRQEEPKETTIAPTTNTEPQPTNEPKPATGDGPIISSTPIVQASA